MEPYSEPEVVLQPVQIEIGGEPGDLAGVIEERRVQVAIDHDAPLPLQEQAVAIAEPPAAVATQVAAAAERRQHEVRNLLIAFQPCGLDETAQRDGPRLAQDREVLHHLVVHLLEAELVIVVLVVVERDAVEAAAARVVGGRTPVEADGALRVQVGDPAAKAGKRRGV